MQNPEHSDGSEKDMGQEMTDAMDQSQHDCMLVRICQEAYVEAQKSVQCVSTGHWNRSFQASFCITPRNAVTTAVKRTSRTSGCDRTEREEMFKEDCRKRETNVDPLPCCKQRVEEQKCWRTASNSVRIANDVLQDTETEIAESM